MLDGKAVEVMNKEFSDKLLEKNQGIFEGTYIC